MECFDIPATESESNAFGRLTWSLLLLEGMYLWGTAETRSTPSWHAVSAAPGESNRMDPFDRGFTKLNLRTSQLFKKKKSWREPDGVSEGGSLIHTRLRETSKKNLLDCPLNTLERASWVPTNFWMSYVGSQGNSLAFWRKWAYLHSSKDWCYFHKCLVNIRLQPATVGGNSKTWFCPKVIKYNKSH